MNTVTLQEWIIKTGPKKVAQQLNVDPSTVSGWRNKKTFPRPDKLKLIHQLSKGRVTYQSIIEDFTTSTTN
jgi:transcriptional regulator with XRE-family HTH domain